MKKIVYLIIYVLFAVLSSSSLNAQSCSIIYFCEKYDGGEVGCSDRFTAGKLTIMVKLDKGFDSTSISIQLTKFEPAEGQFQNYKEIIFEVEPGQSFVFFPDIEFPDKGIYRVILMDMKRNRLASAMLEII